MPRTQPQAEDLGCRPPAGLTAVLLINAVVSAALGAGFVWAVVDRLSGSLDVGALTLYLVCAAACLGFAVWLAWMWHCESRERLIADRDGVALRTRGRSHHAWEQIDRFEVGKLFGEGVVRMEAVDGHCAVMVLCGRERVVLRALRTHSPFGGLQRDDIVARVRRLNELHEARRGQDGERTVLQSGARC